MIKPALAAAGLPSNLRTYDLRHGHASMLIDLGANVLAVAERMGHSDPSVTLRDYGHLFQGVQEQLSTKLDELRAATDRSRTLTSPPGASRAASEGSWRAPQRLGQRRSGRGSGGSHARGPPGVRQQLTHAQHEGGLLQGSGRRGAG